MKQKYEVVMCDGKAVGKLMLSDLSFHKQVSRRKHFLWSLKAWGISESVLFALRQKGCKDIVIHEKDSGQEFFCKLSDYIVHGVKREYGHGMQSFLREERFEKMNDGQLKLL